VSGSQEVEKHSWVNKAPVTESEFIKTVVSCVISVTFVGCWQPTLSIPTTRPAVSTSFTLAETNGFTIDAFTFVADPHFCSPTRCAGFARLRLARTARVTASLAAVFADISESLQLFDHPFQICHTALDVRQEGVIKRGKCTFTLVGNHIGL